MLRGLAPFSLRTYARAGRRESESGGPIDEAEGGRQARRQATVIAQGRLESSNCGPDRPMAASFGMSGSSPHEVAPEGAMGQIFCSKNLTKIVAKL
jgi:hypothetical protein